MVHARRTYIFKIHFLTFSTCELIRNVFNKICHPPCCIFFCVRSFARSPVKFWHFISSLCVHLCRIHVPFYVMPSRPSSDAVQKVTNLYLCRGSAATAIRATATARCAKWKWKFNDIEFAFTRFRVQFWGFPKGNISKFSKENYEFSRKLGTFPKNFKVFLWKLGLVS